MSVWTNEQLEFLKENYNKYNYKELSKILDKTINAVKLKQSRLGLKQEDKYFYNKKYFSEIIKPNQSYWLGFLYADGYITITNNRHFCVGIELQKNDIEHLRQFNKDISGNIEVRLRKRKATYCCNRLVKESEICYIRVFCKEMVLDLIRHGCCERKSLVKGRPLGVPNDLMRDFIRGYFDGNGSIASSYNKKVNKSYLKATIASASEKFVVWLSDYLDLCGFRNNYYRDGEKTFKIQISSKCIKAFLNYIYKDSNLYLKRKYDKYMIAVYGESGTSNHKG